MMKVFSKIDEIWVKKTCTTFPQEDTVWMMFYVEQPGVETQFSPPIRYEIKMRVKNRKASNGDELPYTRVNEAFFNINPSVEARFAFIMINHADAPIYQVEDHLKDLLGKFNASEMDSFGSTGCHKADLLPLGLDQIVARNLPTFNLSGMAVDTGKAIVSTYFQNKNAPIAYDRVTRKAGQQASPERYARDYIGPNSRYGVAWHVGAA